MMSGFGNHRLKVFRYAGTGMSLEENIKIGECLIDKVWKGWRHKSRISKLKLGLKVMLCLEYKLISGKS